MRRLLAFLFVLVTAAPAYAVTVERVVSPGGIEAWLVQDHSNPIVSLSLAMQGGAGVEAKPGLAHMVAGLLDEGAGPYDSQTFQGKLEDLAIELSFDAGKDNFHGNLKTLSDHRNTAFDLFRLALTQPRFDKEPVERVRNQILTVLARELQNPETVAARAWYHMVFAGHPYGVPVRGEPATVKAITTAALKAYAKTWLSREGMVISVVGDVTPEQLKPLLDSTFGALPARHPALTVPDTQAQAAGKIEVIARDNPQSVAMFGSAGIKRDDPQWYAAYVMNYVLGGGGFSSWLTEEVREKRGLAYSVYSYLTPMDHAGIISGGVATQNARTGESVKLIKEQFARMAKDGLTDKELADAKTYLTGSFALQLDSTSSIASLLTAVQLDNLGIDYLDKRNGYIQAVTADQVKDVAQRLLDPDKLTFVVVGKPEGL
ncbi:MAG: M16 family metallopeptidase [Bacteroidota bacterium]